MSFTNNQFTTFDPNAPCLTVEQERVVVSKLSVYRSLVYETGINVPGVSAKMADLLLKAGEKGVGDYLLGVGDMPVFLESLACAKFQNGGGFDALWKIVCPTYRFRSELVKQALSVCASLDGPGHDVDEHSMYMQHRLIYPFLGAYQKYKSICDLLVERNLPLVKSLCVKRKSRGSLSYADLYQEGAKGLIKAVDRYDPDSGNRFVTYAYYWVNATIDIAVKNTGSEIRVPVHTAVELNKVKSAKAQLTQKLGRAPSVAELSRSTGKACRKLNDFASLGGDVVSVDSDSAPVLKTHMTPELYASYRITNNALMQTLYSLLPDKKVSVLVKRFGLDGKPAKSFKSIASELGATEFAVRAAYYDSLKKLKKSPDAIGLFNDVTGKSDFNHNKKVCC